MRGALLIILALLWMNLFVSCRSSRVPSSDNHDQFLFVVVRNDPGVVEGLLASCSCLQIIRMEVIHLEPVYVDFTGKRSLSPSTLRLLIKIKPENDIVLVKDQLAEMEDVVSVKFK